ncbi:hypothetical protein [Bdellovibrio sp. ArHS]|uniref:hypothetical protein n=1 Tax=Bdellovibrio sp. ArHS TaxID=1569284 RepID=UPI0025B7BB92|nr:hypothetical protein [Bdellovibrio sp. ArHS]
METKRRVLFILLPGILTSLVLFQNCSNNPMQFKVIEESVQSPSVGTPDLNTDIIADDNPTPSIPEPAAPPASAPTQPSYPVQASRDNAHLMRGLVYTTAMAGAKVFSTSDVLRPAGLGAAVLAGGLYGDNKADVCESDEILTFVVRLVSSSSTEYPTNTVGRNYLKVGGTAVAGVDYRLLGPFEFDPSELGRATGGTVTNIFYGTHFKIQLINNSLRDGTRSITLSLNTATQWMNKATGQLLNPQPAYVIQPWEESNFTININDDENKDKIVYASDMGHEACLYRNERQ